MIPSIDNVNTWLLDAREGGLAAADLPVQMQGEVLLLLTCNIHNDATHNFQK